MYLLYTSREVLILRINVVIVIVIVIDYVAVSMSFMEGEKKIQRKYVKHRNNIINFVILCVPEKVWRFPKSINGSNLI